MNKIPKVSIVTAMYNHKPFLRRRVDSVLSQTYQDWEWIIVDDCSPDGSFEFVQKLTRHDSRITVLQNDTNCHIAQTNQRGIDLARGEFLYRTDSDDYCADTFLERMCAVLDQNPRVVLAYCRGLYLDQDDGTWGGWPKKDDYVGSGWDEFQRILVQYHIKSPTILFRRAAVVKAGGFTTLPLLSAHDWYLSLRVCLLGDVAYIDAPLAAHRRHGSNVSEDMVRQIDARQTEREHFGVIDDVLSRVPSQYAGEVRNLRTSAYRHSAATVRSVIRWAKIKGRAQEAKELEEMLCKYAVPAEPEHTLKTFSLKSAAVRLGFRFIKPLTYKKLRPLKLEVG